MPVSKGAGGETTASPALSCSRQFTALEGFADCLSSRCVGNQEDEFTWRTVHTGPYDRSRAPLAMAFEKHVKCFESNILATAEHSIP